MCEPDFLGRQAATGYQAANIGNIGRYDVIAAPGGKPPPVAGAAQCGDRDVGVVGAKGVAEGQREKQAEWRTALRLRVEQAGEEHRFRCRLSPPDCLAGTDQPGKIERFGRYGDRGFHAPLRDAISEEVEPRGLPKKPYSVKLVTTVAAVLRDNDLVGRPGGLSAGQEPMGGGRWTWLFPSAGVSFSPRPRRRKTLIRILSAPGSAGCPRPCPRSAPRSHRTGSAAPARRA